MANAHNREFLEPEVLSRLSRLSVSSRLPMIGSVTGMHKSATRGSSVEFAEYRKYVQGDDVRHVDWRVFARSDRFYMKEFEADTNLRCYIVLDTSGSMGFTQRHGSKFDYARRAAATLAYLLVQQGDAVGLLCFTDKTVHDISPRRTPSHLKNIFDTLAQINPDGRTEIVQTIHDLAEKIRNRALVIVFSDFFTQAEPLLDCFQHMRFRKHDLAVFHLLDRLELDFVFDRPIRFVDMESTYSTISDPSVIRAGYRRELDRHMTAIKRGCEEFNVDYHRVITDTDYETILASFLLQRMRKKPGARSRT
ncbi:DUF58 domain-containing protein [Verrucomicrobiota bacterium]